MYLDIDELVGDLAKEYGLSKAVIREAVASPFAFMADKLKSGEPEERMLDNEPLPTFLIKGFGSFKPKYKYGDSIRKVSLRKEKIVEEDGD